MLKVKYCKYYKLKLVIAMSEEKFLIIDFHAHAFPEAIAEKAVENLEEHYRIKIENQGCLANLVNNLKEAQVDKAVLLSAATNELQVRKTNDWLVQSKSDQIIPFGTLHPRYANFLQELSFLKSEGIKGIKFHSDFQRFNIDDKRMWPIYEAIAEDFIVLFHVGDERLNYSSPRKLAKILDAFPKMKVVAAHLGGYMRWDEVETCLLGRELYFDTSSSFWRLSQNRILELIVAHGIDKVLFGTDYPIKTCREEIDNVLNLPLSLEEKKKILGLNAAKLLEI